MAPSPVSLCAQREGLPLLRPETSGGAKDPALMEALASFEADIGVVVAFGQFLPRVVRELPKQGYLINAHASLLPKYRGAAPIARAILAGERRTGISVMRVEREMDAGPVALVRELEIGETETTGELELRMAELAASAIEEALEQIADGSVEFSEQDHAAATHAAKLGREDGRLDWSCGSEALLRRIRALSPSPGAFTTWKGEPLRIHSAERCEGAHFAEPGCVVIQQDPVLAIATGDGFITPLRVQRPGGRAMEIGAFLRGRSVRDGERLGEAPSE
jgi:methionyl-tRNA formyltransferase